MACPLAMLRTSRSTVLMARPPTLLRISRILAEVWQRPSDATVSLCGQKCLRPPRILLLPGLFKGFARVAEHLSFAFCLVLLLTLSVAGCGPAPETTPLPPQPTATPAPTVPPTPKDPWPQDLSQLDRVVAFDELVRLVSEYYPYTCLGYRDIDIPASGDQLRAELVADPSAETFERVVRDFMAALQDGHASLAWTPAAAERYTMPPLLEIAEAESKAIVTRVMDPSLEERGLAVGVEIVAVDGLPVSEALKQVPRFLTACGTEYCRLWKSYHFLFSGEAQSTVDITFIDLEGAERQITAQRASGLEALIRTSGRSASTKRLEDDVGYIYLPHFHNDNPPPDAFFESRLQEMRDLPFLIIDVRGNGGGSEVYTQAINGFLFDQRVEYGRYESCIPEEQIDLFVEPGPWYYEGQVYILIDGGCFSTCADFLQPHWQTGRSILIGRTAQRGGGNPGRGTVKLPDDLEARVSLSLFLDLDGDERELIEPNIYVSLRIEDIRQGVDRDLETALELIAEQRQEVSAHME
jgi:C-terminal processing protease CtpA/Prc